MHESNFSYKSRAKKSRNKKQKSSRGSFSSNIVNVTKFFAIGMTVFGGCIIGSGSYALYKNDNMQNNSSMSVMSKPIISVEKVEGDQSTILLKATSDVGIKTLVYQWNDGKTTTLSGNSGKYLEQKYRFHLEAMF